VGLAGEIRPVTRIEQRIAEAEKLGFKQIFISKFNKVSTSDYQIEITAVTKVEDVYGKLFI
jgi:DNA repair protein RadA/Sms